MSEQLTLSPGYTTPELHQKPELTQSMNPEKKNVRIGVRVN